MVCGVTMCFVCRKGVENANECHTETCKTNDSCSNRRVRRGSYKVLWM